MEEMDCKHSRTGWARWDPDTEKLQIDFKDRSGEKVSTYEYEGFTAADWQRFLASFSRGSHFAEHIRPRFKGVKVWP